jgi:hypothetical protein
VERRAGRKVGGGGGRSGRRRRCWFHKSIDDIDPRRRADGKERESERERAREREKRVGSSSRSHRDSDGGLTLEESARSNVFMSDHGWLP